MKETMNKTNEETLEHLYKEAFEDLSKTYLNTLYGSDFYDEGVHYYGNSQHVSEAQFHELLALIHPSHLEQNMHFVFFPTRRSFIKKIFWSEYGCRYDLASLIRKNPYSSFQSDSHHTFLYFYEFNFEKKWEQTIIVAAILAHLYEKRHPGMTKEKRKKKRELYILRMINRMNEQKAFKETN